MQITTALSDHDIEKCFPVMKQLRPHLTLAGFLDQVRRQMASAGYQLVFLAADAEVKAAIGFRVTEFLAWGKVLYIDDLVTDVASQGKGYGGALLDWADAKARELGCAQVHLDSGYQRHAAHRLYLNKKMKITCHHFASEV